MTMAVFYCSLTNTHNDTCFGTLSSLFLFGSFVKRYEVNYSKNLKRIFKKLLY